MASNAQFGGCPARMIISVVAAVVVLRMAGPASAAAYIPVVQGDDVTVGVTVRQPITRPAVLGYTQVNAFTSDPSVVQVNGVTLVAGLWGVNMTVAGAGLATVAVQWSNPTTGQVIPEYFVVASGVAVDQATAINTAQGNMVLVPASQALGASIASSQAVVAPEIGPDGVSLTAETLGTSVVNIELPRDGLGVQHYQVVIVTVEQAPPPVETSST